MVQIKGLTSNPFQTFNIPDPVTRKTISFSLYFSPRTENWYIDIEYNSFVQKGIKLVRETNIFAKHINIIPFGLAVAVSDNYEPFLINDFVSGRVSLFILDHEEAISVQDLIIAGYTVP